MANGGGAATSYLPQGGREPLCTGQTAHAGQSVSDLPRIREKMPGEERSGKARRVKIVLCRTSVALFRSCGCLGSLPTSATWAITRLTLRGIGILMKLREEGPSVSGAVPSGLRFPSFLLCSPPRPPLPQGHFLCIFLGTTGGSPASSIGPINREPSLQTPKNPSDQHHKNKEVSRTDSGMPAIETRSQRPAETSRPATPAWLCGGMAGRFDRQARTYSDDLCTNISRHLPVIAHWC